MAKAALKDYAEEYIRQIRKADDELALTLMQEFGEKAHAAGWRAAAKCIRDYAGELAGQ